MQGYKNLTLMGHHPHFQFQKENLHFTQTPFQATVLLWTMAAVDDETLMAVGAECGEESGLEAQLADGVTRRIYTEDDRRDVSRLLVEVLRPGASSN